MSERLTIETERLRLTALTAEALGAWIDADPDALRGGTAVEFDEPIEAPPLFGEDLPMFRERMREQAEDLGWWAWLVSTREENRAVGVCGLGGRPDDGAVVIGYSVYPQLEGQGYATEASAGLIRWVLAHEEATTVRATVPTWNLGSVAVAKKLGMTEVGHEVSEEVGEVAVYEVSQAHAGQASRPPR